MIKKICKIEKDGNEHALLLYKALIDSNIKIFITSINTRLATINTWYKLFFL